MERQIYRLQISAANCAVKEGVVQKKTPHPCPGMLQDGGDGEPSPTKGPQAQQ